MPAATSIIGRCTECCSCPLPSIEIEADYQLTYASRSGDLGCVGVNLKGSVDYEDVIYDSDDGGITLLLAAKETRSTSASGSWNYYSGGVVSSSASRTVEVPPDPPVTETDSVTGTDCSVGLAGYVWWGPPSYQSPSEAGAINLLWEYRAEDLIAGTDPSTGIGYSRYRQYYNPTTGLSQNVYGSGSGPGSPWVLIYDREKTASGSITGQTVIGVIEGDEGTEECAITQTGEGVGISVSVNMTVFGTPSTEYTIVVTYKDFPTSTPPKTESYEVTTDGDGLAEIEFLIPQPSGGTRRCIDIVDIQASSYIAKFRVPLSGCYSASWTVTNGETAYSESATWDGVIPSGYDRDNPETWPFLGPFELMPGDGFTDFESDCACLS